VKKENVPSEILNNPDVVIWREQYKKPLKFTKSINAHSEFGMVAKSNDGSYKGLGEAPANFFPKLEYIWFVRESDLCIHWGIADVSYLDNGKDMLFGASGDLFFRVEYSAKLVKTFESYQCVDARQVRERLRDALTTHARSILNENTHKHGHENVGIIKHESAIQIRTRLILDFMMIGLRLDNVTIKKIVQYS